MGDVGEVDDASESARLSRRRALKAGAALGVGVTAWAGPQIGRMGATPAYAAACTVPFSTVKFGACESSKCPDECDSGTEKYIKLTTTTVSGTVNGGTVTATVPAASTSNLCSGPTLRGKASITVPNTTGQCRLEVVVYDGNNQCKDQTEANVKGRSVTLAVLGGQSGTVDLPNIPCGSYADKSSLFSRVNIQCTTSTDPNCS